MPDDLDRAAHALFSLGRAFARHSLRDLLRDPSGRAVDLSRVLVAQAVDEALTAPDSPDTEVTVGTVADRLGIDPSTASRLVADATRDGYLSRTASTQDARRACLTLTDTGRTLVQASRQFQRQAFLDATASWTDAERAEFARQFIRFAQAISARHAEVAPPPH